MSGQRSRASKWAFLLSLALVLIAAPQAMAEEGARFELQVPVLFYHHIKCAPPDSTMPSLYECPEVFAQQMTYLRDQGWHAVTADQVADLLAARTCPQPKQFVVSFDDGSLDGYTNAAPILESLGMRGTYFVTLGKEGGLRTGRITFDQMNDLVARGHAIGSHSATHRNLKIQPADVLYQEIEVAQQRFEDILGFRPRTFAYPYGRYSDLAIEQVRQSGFELAFTVRSGAREASDLPFLSRRIHVPNTATGADVQALMAPYTYGCRRPTPDVAMALTSTGPWKGNNVRASTAFRSQTVVRTGVRAGQTYGYYARLENDAQIAGSMRVTATTAGPPANVRYFLGAVDVTASLVAGSLTLPLGSWTSTVIRVTVNPTAPQPRGTRIRVVLRATSVDDATRVDVGRLVAEY